MSPTRDPGCVCVVDAFSTGAELAGEFRRHGLRAVHVQSAPEIPAIYERSFRPGDFDALLVHDGDPDAVVGALRRMPVRAVVAGAETGTALADALAAALGLPGNPPATSALRRNKFLMGQAVAAAGLPAARQAEAGSVAEALAIARRWAAWPVVAKPLDSAGSDGVTFCAGEAELAEVVGALLMKRNRLDIVNTRVLLQERLVGQQYIVNSVSRGGVHHFTEIWRDDRIEVPGAGLIYDREVLLPRHGEAQDELCRYAAGVLDALGVAEGPCHTELMMTAAGPRLIEVGARLQGGISSGAVVAAIGESHVTLTAKRFAAEDEFARAVEGGYAIRRRIMAVALVSGESGRLLRSNCEELISSLPSFLEFYRKPEVGEAIGRTIDLFTSPGVVYLLHDDLDQIERDYRQIRAWERERKLLVLQAA